MRSKEAEGPALNPLLAAIALKSFASVKYIMETHKGFGLRNYFQQGSVEVEGADFSNLALPLLLATKDIDTLSYLTKQVSFVVSLSDV